MPIIFHTGSLELFYQDSGYSGALEASWMMRRSICIWYYWFRCIFCMRTSIKLSIVVLSCILTLMIDVCIKWYSSLFKDYSFIYYILFRCDMWDSDIVSVSALVLLLFFFLFLPSSSSTFSFFLKPSLLEFPALDCSAVDKVSIDVEFSKVENFRDVTLSFLIIRYLLFLIIAVR